MFTENLPLRSLLYHGKTALVTGSSRGIGRAILLALAQHGATVVLHCRKPCDAAEETMRQLSEMGAKYTVVYADLALLDGAQQIFDQVSAQGLQVDILFLNASIELRRSWLTITDEEYDLQMNTNFRSAIKLLQLFVPGMQARKWGRVITVGSVQQRKPHEAMLVYSASKMALCNCVISLAPQLAPDGVTINNLAPGAVRTDRNAEALSDPAYDEKVRNLIPMKYIGVPEDMAGIAVFMASEESKYMTGQDIYVDGGKGL